MSNLQVPAFSDWDFNLAFQEDLQPSEITVPTRYLNNENVASFFAFGEDEKRDLNKEGLTALHIASFDENTGLVNLLIKSGADTNRKDQYGIAITDLDNDTIRNKIYNELY